MSDGTAPGSKPRVSATVVPAFDQIAVTVLPGSDLVARYPGVLLVARAADSEAGDQALQAVLDLVEISGEAGGRAPGYRVSRSVTSLIEADGVPNDLVLVAATDDGLAVVLAGAGSVTVPERGWRLDCKRGRVETFEIDWPPAPLLLALGPQAGEERPSASRPVRPTRPFDLRAGVVPGGGATLATAAASLASPTGTVLLASGGLPAPLPPPGSSRAAASPRPPVVAPRRFDQIFGVGPSGPRRDALPLPAAKQFDPPASGALVRGYRCRDGHHNDPRALFCAACGIRMAESTGVFVEGRRPPLGLLVFDNGASFSLDANYLLGREPGIDERVQTGQFRPLVLFDTTGVISRRHAEIRLEDWDVFLVDCGSANGTLVAAREASQWSALVPGQPIRMLPGMQVRIGERDFVFESLQAAP